MSDSGFAIYSARVFTGLPRKPWVEAVGIKDGLIAALGSNSEVREALPRAQDLNLNDCLVAPGFVDAHCHFAGLGMSLLMVDLRNLDSLAACRAKIKASSRQLETRANGYWAATGTTISGKRGGEPLKSDLDDLAPHNPAAMRRVCTHSRLGELQRPLRL
jgi:predicted amidohydrolase YtcJ